MKRQFKWEHHVNGLIPSNIQNVTGVVEFFEYNIFDAFDLYNQTEKELGFKKNKNKTYPLFVKDNRLN